ncbi:MAG: hypothetical protein HZC25_04100 [Rhodospirillales bacterium]|nr:hypothetical protein [Rhodospirillales bacterium]
MLKLIIKNRREILALLANLPRCEAATHDEILFFIDRHRLAGRGIGYLDAGLLAAATLSGARLWTRDRRLAEIADDLGCGYGPIRSPTGMKR